MSKNLFNYVLILGTQQWFFEDFKSAIHFTSTYMNNTANPLIYKLVYANGELVKDGKR